MTRFTSDEFNRLNLIKNADGTYYMLQGKGVNNDKIKSVLPSKAGSLKERVGKLQDEINNYPDKVKAGPYVANITNTSIITIQGIVQGLNGSTGLMNNHWTNRKKIKQLYCTVIEDHLKAGAAKKHEGKVSIQYIGYKSCFMDWDNYCASFKFLGDGLVKCQVIKDDNPKIVVQFLPDQIKCKRIDQKVVIIIKDL